MRIFKREIKDKDGKTCLDKKGKPIMSKKWYIDFYFNDARYKISVFTDKTATGNVASLINELMNNSGGTGLPLELRQRADKLPNAIKGKLLTWGILDGAQAKSRRLKSHIDDYWNYLNHCGRVARHADQQKEKLLRVFAAAEFIFYRDISASKLQQTISVLKKTVFKKDEKNKGKLRPVEIGELSQRTRHHILRACKAFCRWMVVDGRASYNPIEHVKPVKVVDVAQRAALEQDELRRLLSYTEASKAAYNLEGYQRAILYRFAAQTGFRASEIAALKVGDIDLKAGRVILSGEHTKNRQDAIIPLKPELTERLKEIFRGKMPQLQAFKMPALDSLAKMFRKDIAAADIKIKPDRGLVDFHCLRHTFGTHLAAAGVHPKTAQTLMRHSNINLTMSRYTHILLGQESGAINSLPNLDSKETEKTGTEND